MPKSGEHNVNNIDSFFRVRPSRTNLREGETVSFLEDGKLVKQEKRNGVVYEIKLTELGKQDKVKSEKTTVSSSGTSSSSGLISAITAGAGLTGGGTTGTVNLDVGAGTGITVSSNSVSIDSTVVTLTGTQTLTNKTLTSPIISSISNTGTLTLPTSTDTLVGRATTDTLSNKTLAAPTINTSLTFDSVALTAIQTSAEAFADNNTSIMTSAAIDDRILSYGYSTTTGTVTSVGITAGSLIDVSGGPITSSGSITIDVDLTEANDMNGIAMVGSDEFIVLDISQTTGNQQSKKPASEIPLSILYNDSGFITATSTDTLSNKTISGSSNTLSNIGNSSLTNSSVTITAGSGLINGGAVSLGSSTTLNVGAGTHITVNADDIAVNTTTLFASPAFTGTATGVNLTLSGNLVVNGTTITIDTDTLAVQDPLIKLAKGNTSSDTLDIGFYGEYYDDDLRTEYAGLFRDTDDDKFKLFIGLASEPTSTVDISGTGYTTATLVANVEGNVTGSASLNLLKANNLSDLTNASTARTNLGLAIGTDVQAYDEELNDIASIDTSTLTGSDNDKFIAWSFSSSSFVLSTFPATQMSGSTNNGLLTYNSASVASVESDLSFDSSDNKLRIEDGELILSHSALNQTLSGRIRFNEYSDESNVSGAYIQYNGASNYLQMFTNTETTDYEFLRALRGSHLLLQPSSGNVGIGTSSPAQPLEVNGRVRASGFDVVDTGAVIYRNSNDLELITYSGYDINLMPSGNVGIGTTSPSTKLHIQDNYDPDDALGYVQIENTNTTSGSAATNAALTTKNYHGTSQFMQWEEHGLRIGSRILTNSGTGDVIFTAGADSEKMRIQAGGNVGIGQTSPGALLTVRKDGTQASSVSTTYQIQTVSASNGGIAIQAGDSSYGYLVFGDNADYDAGRIAYENANHNLSFFTNNAEKVRITSAGNVGIGITDPQAKLDVTGSTAAGSYSLQLRSGDTSTSTDAAQIIFSYGNNPYNSSGYAHSIRTRHNGGATTGNAIDFWLWDYATDTASTLGTKRVMTVDGGGRVGINDSSPTHSLDITGTINATGAYYSNDSQIIDSSGNWVGGGNISEFTNDAGYLTSASGTAANSQLLDSLDSTQFLRSDVDDQSTGILTVDTLKITNDASDTSRHRVTVYDGGSTSYGMMLWNTSGTSGDWATMIYGPYQSNRRISFGKVNNATFADHGDVSEIAYFDLDDSTLRLTADAYVNSNKIWHAGNDGSGTGLDADLLDGNHASAFVRSNFRLSTNASSDANSASTSGIYRVDSGESNIPGGITYGTLVTFNNLADTGFQIIADYHAGGGSLYWRGGNSSTFSGTGSNTNWFKIWNEDNDGSASGLDADLLDGVQGASYLRSDADDTMTESLYMNASDSSEKLYFQWQGTTIGDISGQDTTWLRINQATAKNIYTPRYIRADGGFFVDGSAQGITGDGILRVPNGTYTAPGISFANDTDTGMYLASAGNLFITVGGVPRAQINSNGINTLNSNGYYIDDRRIYEVTSNSSERGGFHPIIASIRNSGRQKYLDEDFNYGTNSVNLYNNAGGSNLVVSRITASDDSIVPPNSSGKVIKVSYNGSGSTSPGFGGVYQLITTEKNHTFVQIFQAKLPSGRTFNTAANSMGNNSTDYFLTSPEGTGKWEWYARVCHAGDGGTFSTSGFIYVTGGSDTAFDWYIANMTQYDVTETPGDYASQTGYYRSNYDVNATLARGLNDDDRIVIEASETKIIGDAVERARLGSYGIRNNVVGTAGAPSYSFVSDTDTGMYRHDTDTIGFSTGGTRMLSIKSDGNIELRSDGSSQGASIQRVGGIQFTWDRDTYGNSNNHAIVCNSDNLIINSFDDVTINIDSNSNDSAETFDVRRHSTSLTGGELLFQVHGDYVYPAKQLRMIDGSAAAPSMSFATDTDLGFYRNGANNMRFSAGNAIRGTWNGDGLELNGGSLGVNATPHTTDGVIRASNDVIAYYSSDERLKENVKPIENALDKVSKIRGVEFDWIVNEEIHPNEGHDVGVIAQEIEKVLPEVVETRASGYKAVKYEKIVSLLIEAINEQQQQINELKEKLNG
jgi:hypothetical protein